MIRIKSAVVNRRGQNQTTSTKTGAVSQMKGGIINHSNSRQDGAFKVPSSLDSAYKKVLEYNSPQISKHKKGLLESPKGAGLQFSQGGHGPVSRSRLESLKKEQIQLSKQEKDSEATIQSLRSDIDELRQRIVSLHPSSTQSTPKSQVYAGEGSLELLLLDKKIRDLTHENLTLEQELSVVAQDTAKLIKQVTELVSKSETSMQAFRSSSTLGMLQSGETLARYSGHPPALNSDR